MSFTPSSAIRSGSWTFAQLTRLRSGLLNSDSSLGHLEKDTSIPSAPPCFLQSASSCCFRPHCFCPFRRPGEDRDDKTNNSILTVEPSAQPLFTWFHSLFGSCMFIKGVLTGHVWSKTQTAFFLFAYVRYVQSVRQRVENAEEYTIPTFKSFFRTIQPLNQFEAGG